MRSPIDTESLDGRSRRERYAPYVEAWRRRLAAEREAAAGLLRLVIELRAGRPFIPRRVHRFRSFEEAQEWSLKMMARPSSRDRPRSTT